MGRYVYLKDIELLNTSFTESQVGIAPRGVVFPFVIPMIVDKSINFDELNFYVALVIYFLTYLGLIFSFFLVPFFKSMFMGIGAFKYGSISIITLTFLFAFLLPFILDSIFLTSFNYLFWVLGIFGNLFMYTHFCTVQNLKKLGLTQKSDSM